MSSSFTCAQCGDTHEGRPTDRGYKLPDAVWAVPEAEREKRATWSTDLCEMDGRFYIRCVLYVPFTFSDESFGWGLWVEVDSAVFQRYLDLFSVDASAEAPATGSSANEIPFYGDALGARVSIHFGIAKDRPRLTLDADFPSSVAQDQL